MYCVKGISAAKGQARPLAKKCFPNLLNDKNHVKVNEFLQIKGSRNIFAIGDITDVEEEKLAQNAEIHGRLVVKNICNLEEGNELIAYKPEKRIMVMSLGKWDGIYAGKNITFMGIIPAILKSLIEWKTMTRYRQTWFDKLIYNLILDYLP